MKIIFVSNYFNHHQKPFCEAMIRDCKTEFLFISTSKMRQERRELGYEMQDIPEYVKYSYTSEKDKQACIKLINEADLVIVG